MQSPAERTGMGRDLLMQVAADTRLAEGPEGVRRILRTVFMAGAIPIRNLAQAVALPVPVVAAVRGELEKRRIVTRKGGVALTDEGLAVVQAELGLSCRQTFARPMYPPTPAVLDEVRDHIAALGEKRPDVDVRLDQSHATPETALKRAVYLYEYDALEGRDVLVLGDDDLTSLSAGLFAAHCGIAVRLTVLEFDRRLVDFLSAVADREGLPIKVIAHDLREEIPGEMVGKFDVFLTDPPYTLSGLKLFVSRGAAALQPMVGKQAFVCFGRRAPRETAAAIGALVDMGFAPVEILPAFNQYVGAQVLGGVSQMIRMVTTGPTVPAVAGAFTGALYTAEQKQKKRYDS